MDQNTAASKCDRAPSCNPDTPQSSHGRKGCHSMETSSLSQGDVAVVIDHCNASSILVPSQSNLNPVSNSLLNSRSTSNDLQHMPDGSSSQRSSLSGDTNGHVGEQRIIVFNPQVWLAVSLALYIIQIISCIIVLSLSRNERPKAPLALWIMGYACGCLAMLPVSYWRHRPLLVRPQEQERLASSSAPSTSVPSSPSTLPLHTLPQGQEMEGRSPIAAVQDRGDSRLPLHITRFIDCFFAVWFVIGCVWVLGDHTSSHDAPNLYKLCVVLLAFDCLTYGMPFVICASVCCCLPCIITLLRHHEESANAKGAAPEVIAGLPIYKFKTKKPQAKECKDESDSDCESNKEGGVFAPGTERERMISGQDAVCCICLGHYKDGADLKELQCAHFFHVDCIDNWLKVNATCPLCKQGLSSCRDVVQ